MSSLTKLLPKNYLSFFIGKLAEIEGPPFIIRPIINWFANKYGVKREESNLDILSYKSVSQFFTRDLKPGIRPINGKIVSPVDGTLRSCGAIQNGMVHDVKGQNYSIRDLLGDSNFETTFKDGYYFNFYLAPGDYHNVHSPVSGEIHTLVHIPGKLWPVNDWSFTNIKNLFGVNEKVSLILNTEMGQVALVMVGATNVGKISVSFDNSIIGNQVFSEPKIQKKYYDPSISISVGTKVGTFNLGSTVVLLFEKKALNSTPGGIFGSKVIFGQKII
ncbi:MAG: archaetidylserine decarboxylase [bacterium]|nr:archaetidylserine decarboxylase [bacterium]